MTDILNGPVQKPVAPPPRFQPTLAEQVEEVEREVVLRTRVYSQWVMQARLSQAMADIQLDRMSAALQTLRVLLQAERAS